MIDKRVYELDYIRGLQQKWGFGHNHGEHTFVLHAFNDYIWKSDG